MLQKKIVDPRYGRRERAWRDGRFAEANDVGKVEVNQLGRSGGVTVMYPICISLAEVRPWENVDCSDLEGFQTYKLTVLASFIKNILRARVSQQHQAPLE